MEISTHPLLALVECNRNGLKSMLTHYIDATVDSHYNAMKLNIVEMIQSGMIGTQHCDVTAFGMTLRQPPPANTVEPYEQMTLKNEVPLANTINTDQQMIKQEFDDDYATNCEKCIKGICNSVCENNDNTSGNHTENGNDTFDEPNDCAELEDNQTNQSIVSNDILPSHDNSINIEPTQIKQECHEGSSITSIPLDFNRNVVLNNIAIDEPIERQNTQIQTDAEFNEIDEYTYADYCKDREYLNNPDCEDCANGDCDLDHENSNNNNHLYNDVSVGDGNDEGENENEVSNTQIFSSTENHMTNIETDQKDQSVNIERNNPLQLTPSTITGIRSSTRKRIPKKVFGFDNQSNDDNVKRCKIVKVKPQNIEEKDEDNKEEGKSQVVIVELNCTEPGCSQTVTSRALWREHMRNDHHKNPYHQVETTVQLNNRNTTKIFCPSTNCTGVYNSHSSFRNHWSYYHHPGQYLCPSCPFTANLHCKVQNHLNISHGPLVCSHEHCGKKFAKMSELKRHELTHSKDCEKQFKCTWTSCSRLRFKLLEGAVRHVMAKHLTKSPNNKQNDIVESRDPHEYIRKITK